MEEDESVASRSSALLLESSKAKDSSQVLSRDSEPQDQPPVSMSYQCELCPKEFGSRKALYGHMRIHNAREKSTVKKGKAAESVRDESSPEDENQRAVCEICWKVFRSLKSLHGHMRSHPEREWRGMRPPASSVAKLKLCVSSTMSGAVKVDDQIDGSDTTITGPMLEPAVIDMSKGLLSWLVTGKRGRSSTIASSSCSGDYYLASKQDALNDIAGDPLNSPSLSKSKIEPSSQEPFLGSGFTSNSEPMLGKEIQCFPEDMEKMKNKRRRPSELEAADIHDRRGHIDPASASKNYRCSSCNRSFSSYQALGGHISSHNKVKSTHGQLGQRQDRLPDPEHSSQPDIRMDRSDSTKWHECEICKRRFRTGQALGGHKRLHWTRPASESPGEASKMVQQKPLNIDLNEMPPTEEEGESGPDP